MTHSIRITPEAVDYLKVVLIAQQRTGKPIYASWGAEAEVMLNHLVTVLKVDDTDLRKENKLLLEQLEYICILHHLYIGEDFGNEQVGSNAHHLHSIVSQMYEAARFALPAAPEEI